ncbi:MAG: hypothetical protein ACP5IT_11425 [Thermoproteota archaeon]
MARVWKEEYRLGRIAASTTNASFIRELKPQPAFLREVHAQGSPSTNFSIRMYDKSRKWLVDKIYEWKSANLEFHDHMYPHLTVLDTEKRYIFIEVDNNDTANYCDLILILTVEVAE